MVKENCEFYCCDQMIAFSSEEEFTVKEISEILGFNYCPFCSHKLTTV